MSKYRTAQGRILDMAALASQNERARAVGNMKVNARGDTIDSEGKIIVPVTEKVATKYSKTVGQRSAQQRSTTLTPNKPSQTQAQPQQMELTEEEKDLLSDEEIAQEVMETKAKEQKK